MAAYTITGAGIIDLRFTDISGDGMTFATTAAATAQVNASQFTGSFPQQPFDSLITGNGFSNTLEIFVNVNSFSAQAFTFDSWNPAVDLVVFRGTGSADGTSQRDLFDLGPGSQTMRGHGGDDTAIYSVGAKRFEGGEGIDTLIADFSYATTYQLGSGGNLAADASGYSGAFFTAGQLEGIVTFTGVDLFHITGTQFGDTIRTGDGIDTVNGGNGNDVLITGRGNDIIDGGAGNADRWIAYKSADGAGLAINLNTRTNTYTGPGSVTNIEAVQLTLGAGNDVVVTSIGALSDTVIGGAGNDTASFARGEDRFEGGTGNDTLIADFSTTTTYNLNMYGFSADANGYSGDLATAGRLEGAVVFTGVDRFQITGTQFNDNLRTGDENDTLNGGAGNDILNSGRGVDIIDGGAGNADRWIADKSTDGAGLAINLNTRTNTYTGPGSVTNIEAVQLTLGAGNDVVVTSIGMLADTVIGGGGDDTASFARGEDRFEGGTGFDTLIADFSTTTASGLNTSGFVADANGYSGQFVTAGRSEGAVVFTGVDRFNLTGTQFNDNLRTGDSDDTLIGGGGVDTLTGGGGNDIYVNPLGDTIVELVGGGADSVQTNVSFSLAAIAHVENITLTGSANINAAGNAAGNMLTGNSGNNILNGGAGPDTMAGGAGNDIYYVDSAGDQTIELFGGGIDLISTSGSRTLSANIENLNLSGTANIDGSGNTSANIINGNTGNNILRGYAGVDTLNGGAGNDILIGGTSSDVLNPGSDTVRDIIRFGAATESTGSLRDIVTGMDLNGEDVFDFTVVPTNINAQVNAGALSLATLNANIASAVNAALSANGAVLFDPSSGDLNIAGHVYLVVDANGDGSYTPNADYLVQLINPTGTLTLDDFI
jgi:Ca2+-binding RTX toxin-like protein